MDRKVAAAFVLVAELFFSARGAQAQQAPDAAAPGFAIVGQFGQSDFDMLVSNQGVRVIESTGQQRGSPQPVRAAIARYADQKIFGLDFATQTYTETALATVVEATVATDKQIGALTPGSEVGGPPALGFSFPGGSLQRTDQTATIGGRPARAYLASAGDFSWRLWYATDLPVAPEAVRSQLLKLSPDVVPAGSGATHLFIPVIRGGGAAAGPTAAQETAGKVLLRAELRQGDTFVSVLNVTSVMPTSVPSSTFDPPAGWQKSPAARGSAANVRGVAPAETNDLVANAIQGPGPVTGHPELYVYYWGAPFADPAHAFAMQELSDAVKQFYLPAYMDGLAGYGIGNGSVQAFHIDGSSPTASVGSSNFAAIEAFITSKMLTDSTPMVWWTVGGHDPIYAIFVPESDVDSSGWGGYHFAFPTFAHVFLPFPINLFTHDAIPWLIAKMPNQGLTIPLHAPALRSQCRAVSPPTFCAALSRFDTGTATAAHEFVEAASDPFPFTAWTDPSKQPFYERSELSDICQFDQAPWGTRSRVGSTVVETYWSNFAGGCLPESRPSLQIVDPVDNAQIPWTAGGVSLALTAAASDPLDGVLKVTWRVDNAALSGATTPKLPTGPHTITVRGTDSQGLQASDTTQITIFANPPVISITSPADGATFNTGQTVVLRGSATDPQDGFLPNSALLWTANGTSIGTGSQLSTSFASAGDYTVTLSATDSAGLTSSASITLHIVAGSGGPTVTILEPANNSQFFDGGVIHFAASVTENGSETDNYTVHWKDDVDGVMGTGKTLDFTLSGGGCAFTEHHVTAFVITINTQVEIFSDKITVFTGAICQ